MLPFQFRLSIVVSAATAVSASPVISVADLLISNRRQPPDFIFQAALEKAINEQMSQCPIDTPIREIHESAFRSTFRPEYYGRCRGMGSGVTAIQVYPDLSRRSKISGTNHANSREMREIDQLKVQMMNMQTTINCLLNTLPHQGSREDCSGTSAGAGVYLSTDQVARMMNSIAVPNQSTESTRNYTPIVERNTRIHAEQGGHDGN